MKELFQHLQYLIRRHDSVRINGLGTLKAIDLPPLFDEDGKVMIAPARAIYFETYASQEAEDNCLRDSYARRSCIDAIEADKRIENAVESLRNRLADKGMVIGGRLGSFFLRNGRIEFKPNLNSSAFNPFGLYAADEREPRERTSVKDFKPSWYVKRKIMSLIAAVSLIGSAVAI